MEGDDSFPGPSSYRSVFLCVRRVDGVHALFCGSWEFHPLAPLGCLVVSVVSLVFLVVGVFPEFEGERAAASAACGALCLLFVASFVLTIAVGPGYFPFYWSHSAMSEHEDNSPSGIISSKEQLEWARRQARPPRSIVSRTARRIVMMPEHYCMVTNTWIGKRNTKLFILFNLYNSLYSLIALVYSIRFIAVRVSSHGEHGDFGFIASILLILASGYFGLFSAMFCFASMHAAIKGVTSWENSKQVDSAQFDHGCLTNLEQVCGARACLPCWLCPIPPFMCKSNSELIQDYPSYYE